MPSSSTLTWAEIDNRIRQLIELGQYLSKDEVPKAIDVYTKCVANRLATVYHDFFMKADFPGAPAERTYPELEAAFTAMLPTPERGQQFIPAFEKAVDTMTENPRRRDGYTPQFVKMLVSSFQRDPMDYPQEEDVLPAEHYRLLTG